jgi:uncharacterized protein (DUF2267 family)
MAGHPDPFEHGDYASLLEALAREGLGQRREAVKAVEAVVCALARRTEEPEYQELRDLLPDPFRGRLVPCERHASAAPSPMRTPEDFVDVVADDLGRPADETEGLVRAVLAAVRAQLPDAEAEEVLERLPPELVPLWRLPS